MRTYTSLAFVILWGLNIFGQSYLSNHARINSLDFSRFPKVDLFVSTVDTKGEPIQIDSTWLPAIKVIHNGITIPVREVNSVYALKQRGETELYISLVFDNSSSMEDRNKLLEQAAQLFIAGIRPGDYVNVIDFGRDQDQVTIPEMKEPIYARERIAFGNSKQLLAKAVLTPNFTKRTYMYDALLFALSTLQAIDVLGKKVVIFFSDGQNIGSVASNDDVKKYADDYEIPIYAIDLGKTENRLLKNLAANSGGEYFFVTRPEELAKVYESLLKLLKSQYRFTYTSPDEFVSKERHSVDFSISLEQMVRDSRQFRIQGDKIGYYNLVYYENLGMESVKRYLDYIFSYPTTKYKDFVELKLGNLWMSKGDFSKANSTYNKIIRNTSSPAYLDALYQKGILLEKSKQYTLARKTFGQILNTQITSPLKAKSMLDIAKTYSAEGNYASAIETYSQLSAKYAGTEYASEALLQSANLSLQMGDLTAASSNLTNVVNTYNESKSAVYAKLELANLEAQNHNLDQAVNLYKEVIGSNADASLVEQSKIKLIDTYLKKKDYFNALESLKELSRSGPTLITPEEISMKLIHINYAGGDFLTARNEFENRSASEQQRILQENQPLLQQANPPPTTMLINGFFIKGIADANAVQIVELPEYRNKFSVVGPIYSLPISDVEKSVSLPVYASWLTDKSIIPGESGVYTLKNNILELVTDTYMAEQRAYSFTTKGGTFLLLSAKPKVITLYNIYFDLGKSTIRKDAEKNLYETTDYLKSFPSLKMEIAGHTDSTGSDELNTKLALARAESIKGFFVLNGIAEDRLVTRGYGSQFPVAANTTEENRQKNRRTEFIILSGSGLSLGEQVMVKPRYMVSINEFSSIKEAYDMRKFLMQRGYSHATVLCNQMQAKDTYILVLGIFEKKEDAQNALNTFTQEYKQFLPRIVEM